MLEWPTEDERLDYVDWQDEVSNGDTALGFRDWLTHQVVTETDPRDHPYSGAITYASNCTEGLMCPSCGSADRFVVEGRTAAVLIDDGTDEYGYFDFGDEDTITCSGCGHKATVRSFTLPPGPNWRSYGDGLLSAALPSPHHEGHAVVTVGTGTDAAAFIPSASSVPDSRTRETPNSDGEGTSHVRWALSLPTGSHSGTPIASGLARDMETAKADALAAWRTHPAVD